MDAESIVTIREEFSDDFLSLAKEQLVVVKRLVERLDDDQLGTQLQFERFEWEHRQKETVQMKVAINLNDEEQSPDQPPIETEAGAAQPDRDKTEQPDEAGSEQPT